MGDLLGSYDLHNNIEINIVETHEHGIMSTIIHEIVHVLLTKETDYGKLASFILKVAIFLPKYKNTAQFLVDEMREVQEAIAVFIEYSYLNAILDEHEFKKALILLERNNRTYYNYLKPLLFLIDILKKTENKNEVYMLVKLLGFVSLEVPIPLFTREQLSNTSKLKALLKNKSVSPKSKFADKVKYIRTEINKGTSIENIINSIISMQSEEVQAFEKEPKQNLMEIVEPDLKIEQKKQLLYLLKGDELLANSDSDFTDLITISSMNIFKGEEVEYNALLNMVGSDVGTLYIKLGLMKNDEFLFFIEFTAIKEEKRYILNNVSEKQLNSLINSTDALNAICCSPQLVDPTTKKLICIDKDISRNIYVVFNNSYAITRQFFMRFLEKDVTYPITAINFNDFDVFLLPYQPKIPFLFFVIPEVGHTFYNDTKETFKFTFKNFNILKNEGKVNAHTFNMVELMVNTIAQIPILK